MQKKNKFREKWIKDWDFLVAAARADKEIPVEEYTKVGVKF